MMKMLYFVTILCLVVFAFGQNSEVSFKVARANQVCSLNDLLNNLCTADDDIKCRTCFFKKCHKIQNLENKPLPDFGGRPFGRPFAPQDCNELNACLAEAGKDCKNE